MKVKIIKASNSKLWYADKIGTVYDVEDWSDIAYDIINPTCADEKSGIFKKDTEEFVVMEYKVGDKVVVEQITTMSKIEKSKYIGLTGTIVDIDGYYEDMPYKICFNESGSSCGWMFAKNELSPAPEKKFILFNSTTGNPTNYIGTQDELLKQLNDGIFRSTEYKLIELGQEIKVSKRTSFFVES